MSVLRVALLVGLMVGCGQSSQAKYEHEKARLAAMEAQANELMSKIMAETNAIVEKKKRDVELLRVQVDSGIAPPAAEVDKAGNDRLLEAMKRARNSPFQKDLSELSVKIEAQKKVVEAARKDFID